MKVLMFGWEFPPHNSGGLGVACLGLTRALASSGVEITFVLPKKADVRADFLTLRFAESSGSFSATSIDALLTAYVTPASYNLQRRGFPQNLYGTDLFAEVRRYALRAREIAKRESFDLIHAHDWLSFLAGLEAKKVSGRPLVVHVHATEFDRTGGHTINQQIYDIEREGLEQADRIIAVSNFTKNLLTARYGIDPEKILVVHNGIDEQWRTPAICDNTCLRDLKRAGHRIVLFVGRLTLQKGPDYFLKAAKRVLEYNQKVRFVITGSGDMYRKIVEEAAWLGISDKVLFTGFLRDGELREVYQAADLFVMPSVSEPFGIAPLEALQSGTPVLVSKQSGASEVLTHALKVDFWDTDETANKILAVLAHGPLHETLRDNGRRDAEKMTWSEAARKCMEIYTAMLGNV